MPSFYIPLSGLDADSTALNTIANNLSNMNTTGFKAQTTNFSDLFYQQVGTTGSGDEIQVGTGVQVASNSSDFTGGSISSTGVSTDAAIDGSGFFVLDAGGGSQLYTRDGNFQVSSTGTLESTQGQAVMGYLATNGVISTSGGLTDLSVPSGQVMQPSATTNFSMTQNLDSQSAIGTQTSGQVQVFDSLGKNYEATVTYTNLGNNKWSYAITLPDTLSAAPATASAASTMALTAATPIATSVTAATTVSVPAATVATPLTATTVPDTSTSPALTPVAVAAPITSPAVSLSSVPNAGTTTNTYTFDVNGTVKGNTSLVLNIPTVGGVPASLKVTVTPTLPDESVSAFFTDITNALNNANPPVIIGGGTGITVTNPSANKIVISGPTATVSIDAATVMKQDVALTTSTFNFASSNGQLAMVGPSTGVPPTNLTVQIGAGAVISAPTFTTNEDVATYAAALQNAVGAPATSGVTISGSDTTGVLTITGPANNMVIGGNIVQNFSGTQTNFTLGSYTDPKTGLTTQAGIDGKTSLTFVGAPTITGGTAANFTVTPSIAAGESLTAYLADIQAALKTNKVSGVTVTGTNGVLSITGPSTMSITGPTGLGSSPIFNQDILGTTVSSSVAPTSPVTITSTVTLPAASLTPASSSTTTLSPLAPTISAVSSILPQAAATVASVNSNTLVANTATPGTIAYTLTPTGMISSNTVLEITDGVNTATITPATDMTPLAFEGYVQGLLNTASITATATGVNGIQASNTGGTFKIVGAGISIKNLGTDAGVIQDVTETTNNFNLVTSDGALATVAPSTGVANPTTLAIVLGSGGTAITTTAPAFTTDTTLSNYATALQDALPAHSGVTVQVNPQNPGQLQITGPANMTITGNLVQAFNATNLVYNFGATGTVSPSTDLKITGETAAGGIGSTQLPNFSGNPVETVTDYKNDLIGALTTAGITGVTVNANSATGQLTITGPSTITTSGSIARDLDLTTTNYNFVTSNGTQATVSPSTTLAITEGNTTVTVPAFSTSQTVSTYAASLQSALTSNGITDVTVTGTSGVLSITGPANMSIAGKVIQTFTGAQSSFDFGSYTDPNTGLTTQAMVAPASSLTISGPTTAGGTTTITIAPSNPAGEPVAQYVTEVQNALAAANITGMTVTATNGVLSITGPDTVTVAGTMNQNMLGTTHNYAFEANSTIDSTTNLKITGETTTGATATIVAPTVTAGETMAQYATALTAALSTAGITNAQVTATNGQLSIVGANLSTTGSINQGLADTTINYNFGSNATVNPATALTIVGPTVSGTPATAITVAPTVAAGETVAAYAADLRKALKAADIDTGPDGVSITVNGGQLSIIGPAATLKTAGIASQDLTTTTISYAFGTSGSSIAAVDPKTNLTITALTASGATATTVAPTITLGESLAQYVNDLTSALSTAGIAGVSVSSTAGGVLSITGSNLSTSGSVIQDPVASTNSTGTLTFDANGNLVSPTTNLGNVTFAGLSDSAATMNMTWGLFNSSGKGEISQTAATSGQSAQNQNGYTSGEYQSFTVGSDGTITAKYSNGQNQTVGQIGLATVSNMQGLTDVGSTEYQTTTASGFASVGVASSGGRGILEGSSLEASNVNISAEFSDLIVAQRAFEANAKSVTTFDTITQETINMIH
jgi:flagellar hook-basal body protein